MQYPPGSTLARWCYVAALGLLFTTATVTTAAAGIPLAVQPPRQAPEPPRPADPEASQADAWGIRGRKWTDSSIATLAEQWAPQVKRQPKEMIDWMALGKRHQLLRWNTKAALVATVESARKGLTKVDAEIARLEAMKAPLAAGDSALKTLDTQLDAQRKNRSWMSRVGYLEEFGAEPLGTKSSLLFDLGFACDLGKRGKLSKIADEIRDTAVAFEKLVLDPTTDADDGTKLAAIATKLREALSVIHDPKTQSATTEEIARAQAILDAVWAEVVGEGAPVNAKQTSTPPAPGAPTLADAQLRLAELRAAVERQRTCVADWSSRAPAASGIRVGEATEVDRKWEAFVYVSLQTQAADALKALEASLAEAEHRYAIAVEFDRLGSHEKVVSQVRDVMRVLDDGLKQSRLRTNPDLAGYVLISSLGLPVFQRVAFAEADDWARNTQALLQQLASSISQLESGLVNLRVSKTTPGAKLMGFDPVDERTRAEIERLLEWFLQETKETHALLVAGNIDAAAERIVSQRRHFVGRAAGQAQDVDRPTLRMPPPQVRVVDVTAVLLQDIAAKLQRATERVGGGNRRMVDRRSQKNRDLDAYDAVLAFKKALEERASWLDRARETVRQLEFAVEQSRSLGATPEVEQYTAMLAQQKADLESNRYLRLTDCIKGGNYAVYLQVELRGLASNGDTKTQAAVQSVIQRLESSRTGLNRQVLDVEAKLDGVKRSKQDKDLLAADSEYLRWHLDQHNRLLEMLRGGRYEQAHDHATRIWDELIAGL